MNGTALVTGGARRIGRSIALSLAEKGFRIALHYRSSLKEAKEVARNIEQKGMECHLFSCDFNDMVDVQTFIPKVFERFPDCNLLINNASQFERAHLMDTDVDLFDRHFNVNFKTPFLLSRDFARHCRKGQIINILDTKISSTLIEYFVYTLTKKSLFEFTKLAAKELGPRIRVNAVSPGLILPSALQSKEDFEKMGARIPLGRKGDTENVVATIHFFIENSFITGECIFVDGGEHLV